MPPSSIAAQLTEKLTSPSRALIVEDHGMFADMMCRILDQIGMLHDVAETGKTALELYDRASRSFEPSRQHRCPYDIVFIDQRLPDMGGIEIAKSIRAMWPDQILILMTGYPLEYDPDLGLIGLWYKGAARPDFFFREIRRMCNLLGIPVLSTPL